MLAISHLLLYLKPIPHDFSCRDQHIDGLVQDLGISNLALNHWYNASNPMISSSDRFGIHKLTQ